MKLLFLMLPDSPEAMVASIYPLVEEGIITFIQYLDVCIAVGVCVGA